MKVYIAHSEQDDNPYSITANRSIAEQKRDEILDFPYEGVISEQEVEFTSEPIFAVIHGEYDCAYVESLHMDYNSARNSIPKGEEYAYHITEWQNGELINKICVEEE